MVVPMMDVISRYLWMLDVLTSQGKIDVLVHDQAVVEGEGAGLPLDPGLGSADASLHPDPGHAIVSADPALEGGTKSQHPAAAVNLKHLTHNLHAGIWNTTN